MRLRELLDSFDDWNRNVKINKHHPDTPMLMQGKIVAVAEGRSPFHNRLMDADVITFGFYNDILCVRVVYEGRKRK